MVAHQEAVRYCFQLGCKTEDVPEGIVSFFEEDVPKQRTILKALRLSWTKRATVVEGRWEQLRLLE